MSCKCVSPGLDNKIGIFPGIHSGFDLRNHFFCGYHLFTLQVPATFWKCLIFDKKSCGTCFFEFPYCSDYIQNTTMPRITINEDGEGICEVFGSAGKAGGCAASQIEAVGRLISLALRSGIDIDSILKQISGIRCPNPVLGIGGQVFSCSDAIAKALQAYMDERDTGESIMDEETTLDHFTEESKKKPSSMNVVGVCPKCSSALMHMEGCATCLNCGYSRC